ncbi:hypothetical protein GGX14DRAFT_555708 [Mycena pura]|uniref:Uncharacterized protein n=1 Tax=Mycena pura TaxID=153505 RepID=A0AAD6YRK8_9AGAR|nr:hypothetical protein GGX14DRAFT_555708 [Mycena pura]
MRRTHGEACPTLPPPATPLHVERPAGYTLLAPPLYVARTAGHALRRCTHGGALLPAAPPHAAPPHSARPATRPPFATPHVVGVRPAAALMLVGTPYAALAVSSSCGARRARRGVRCMARRMPYIFAPRHRTRRICATHTRRTCATHTRRTAHGARGARRCVRCRRTAHDSMHGGVHCAAFRRTPHCSPHDLSRTPRPAARNTPPHAAPAAVCMRPPRMSRMHSARRCAVTYPLQAPPRPAYAPAATAYNLPTCTPHTSSGL